MSSFPVAAIRNIHPRAVTFAMGIIAVLVSPQVMSPASARDRLVPVESLAQQPCPSCDTDAVWRASRPLVVRSQSSQLPAATHQHPGRRLMMLRLEQAIEQSEANAQFWAARLNGYRRLKYSEAVTGFAGHAELQLLAARHQAETLRAELSLLNRGLSVPDATPSSR